MHIIHKKWRYKLLSFFITISLLLEPWGIYTSPAYGDEDGAYTLMNDRCADIINATPMSADNLVIPGGLDGSGQIVGIADSGLDKGSISDIHPDLQSDPGKMPRVAMLKSYTDRITPDDPVGHGTHMAATIVGSGKASDGQYQGIAPGASLYFQALLDSQGELDIPADIDELFLPAYSAGVRVHVDGWGQEKNVYSITSSQIDKFIFEHNDFLPIFGAGNSGPGEKSVSTEANSKNALSVGASQVPRPAFSTNARYSDQPSASSSRGPADDGRIKPEILAPGSVVISACSSLVSSNYPANEMYTRMGGSSMAAAVTGGAAALLRQYLKSSQQANNPSASLIKALLINGTRVLDGQPSRKDGFGMLDLAGTILPLEEGCSQFTENKIKKAEEKCEYNSTVYHQGTPFKATLAWTDPVDTAGSTSTLVNNLDLIVTGPDGTKYYGNDFSNSGKADSLNNVEQVYIPHAKAGEYVITVKGTSLSEEHNSQKYSLVYGQSMQAVTIKAVDDNHIILSDDTSLSGSELKINTPSGTGDTVNFADILPGSELYIGYPCSYLFSRQLEYGGMQLINTAEGMLMVEMNSDSREGGYYLDRRQYDGGSTIMVNDEEADPEDFPAGAHMTANINPFYQTLWGVEANAEEIKGYLEAINLDNKQVKLIGDNNKYSLLPWAAVSYINIMADCSVEEAPYGYAETADINKLVTGMKVKLVVTPGTRLVNYIQVERKLAVGRIAEINSNTESISLDTGFVYQLFPGTPVYRDGIEVKMSDLQTGDFVAGLLLPDKRELLRIDASSVHEYGRIFYYNDKEKALYLIGSKNTTEKYTVSGQTAVFRWGSVIDTASIQPGIWARVTIDPDDGSVRRIDVAETARVVTDTLHYYNADNRTVYMASGAIYSIQPHTVINSNGCLIEPEDLVPGIEYRVTTLVSPGSDQDCLAAVEIDAIEGTPAPQLKATARSLNNVLIIQGTTTADQVSLYRGDGSRVVLQPSSNGQFNRIFPLLEKEAVLKLVAVDSHTGLVSTYETELTTYETSASNDVFPDAGSHSARDNIAQLASQGIISGYPDGTFHPDSPVTRLEFIKMLVQYYGLEPDIDRNRPWFTDEQDISWWGLGAVKAACDYGIVEGYPDGSLKPEQFLTQSEAAVIIDRVLSRRRTRISIAGQLSSTTGIIPDWAMESVFRGFERGMFQGIKIEAFNPSQVVTRAEVAIFLTSLPPV